MWQKRKSYKTSSFKRTTNPKTYRNGYVKTSKTLTAYLQGYKLILTDYDKNSVGEYVCRFKVTKNSVIVKKINGIFDPIKKTLEVKMGAKRYFLTPFKK